MLNNRENFIARAFLCSALPCGLIIIALSTPAVLARQSEAAKKFQSLSRLGVKFYRVKEYSSAVKMFEEAVAAAESGNLTAEQRANAYLNLFSCQRENNDYKNAAVTIKKAEQTMVASQVDNEALKIRLLRRKIEIDEHLGDWCSAAAKQAELCRLYEKHVGRLVVSNFSEMARWQHFELKARHYEGSIKVGRNLLQLLAKFRMPPGSDIALRTNLTQGISLIFAGQRQEGCVYLQKVYEPATGGSDDLAAYAATWLVHCAELEKRETQRIYWLKKLDAVAQASKCSTKDWLHRVELEAQNGPG